MYASMDIDKDPCYTSAFTREGEMGGGVLYRHRSNRVVTRSWSIEWTSADCAGGLSWVVGDRAQGGTVVYTLATDRSTAHTHSPIRTSVKRRRDGDAEAV